MYHSQIETCEKHYSKATRNVMGNRDDVNVNLRRVKVSDPFFCYCGRKADFQLNVIVDKGQ